MALALAEGADAARLPEALSLAGRNPRVSGDHPGLRSHPRGARLFTFYIVSQRLGDPSLDPSADVYIASWE